MKWTKDQNFISGSVYKGKLFKHRAEVLFIRNGGFFFVVEGFDGFVYNSGHAGVYFAKPLEAKNAAERCIITRYKELTKIANTTALS